MGRVTEWYGLCRKMGLVYRIGDLLRDRGNAILTITI